MTGEVTLSQLDKFKISNTIFSRLEDTSKTISLLVPDEWVVGRTEKFPTIFVGPEIEGMRVNVGIAFTRLSRGNKLTVQLLGRQVLDFLQTSYNEFKLIEEQEIILDESRPGMLRTFGWKDMATGVDVIQIMLLVANGNTIYDITATLGKLGSAEQLPIIYSILKSIRFIRQPDEISVAD